MISEHHVHLWDLYEENKVKMVLGRVTTDKLQKYNYSTCSFHFVRVIMEFSPGRLCRRQSSGNNVTEFVWPTSSVIMKFAAQHECDIEKSHETLDGRMVAVACTTPMAMLTHPH